MCASGRRRSRPITAIRACEDYRATGLLLDIRQWYPPHHPEATRGGVAWQDTNRVKTSPHPAFFGFAAGYGVHVIDRTGRTDPLLARLPAERGTVFPQERRAGYRTGTNRRCPTRKNRIADPALAAYYDRVRLVTRGPLLEPVAPPRGAAAARPVGSSNPPVPISNRPAVGE